MRTFVLWSHVLLVLVAIPFTGLLGFWAILAESGGKNPHPEVLPPMLWGIAELTWTFVVSTQRRYLPGPSVPWRRRLLAAGLVLTLIVCPAILIATTFGRGSERAFIVPYLLLALSCRLTRVGLADRE